MCDVSSLIAPKYACSGSTQAEMVCVCLSREGECPNPTQPPVVPARDCGGEVHLVWTAIFSIPLILMEFESEVTGSARGPVVYSQWSKMKPGRG